MNDGNYFDIAQNIKASSIIDSCEVSNSYMYRVRANIYGKSSTYTESNSIYTLFWVPWKKIYVDNYFNFNEYWILNISDNLEILAVSFLSKTELNIFKFNLNDGSYSLDIIQRENSTYNYGDQIKVHIEDQRYFIIEYTGTIYKSYFINIDDLSFDDENCPKYQDFVRAVKLNENEIAITTDTDIEIFDINKREIISHLSNNFEKTRFKLIRHDNNNAFVIGGTTSGIYTYNNINNEWSLTNTLKHTYYWYDYKILQLSENEFMIAGGQENYSKEAEIFDYSSNNVTSLPLYKGDRFNDAILLPNGKLLLLSSNMYISQDLITETIDLNSDGWDLVDKGPVRDGSTNLTNIKEMYAKSDGYVLLILNNEDIYQSQKKMF